MSEIGLKIQIGDTNIELNGDAEIVKDIFNDIRKNGLGKIVELEKITNTHNEQELLDKKIKTVEKESKEVTKTKKTISKKNQVKGSSTNITATYQYIENLPLSQQQRADLKEYFKSFQAKANYQKVVIIANWLRSNTDLNSFDTNIIYTLLRIVSEKASFNIPQTLRDAKSKHQLITDADKKGYYRLTPIGEDYIADIQRLGDGE